MTWLHWIGLPPYFFASWLWLGRGTPWKSPYYRLAFTLPFAFSLTVVLPLLIAKIYPNFVYDYWIGAALCLGGGLALGYSSTATPQGSWLPKINWLRILALLWLGFLTYMVAILALRYSFHDQLRTQAHPAVIASAVRGNYPPHLQAFPNIPLKYHFGADMLAAAFSYALGLQAFRAIDAIQIAGWIAAIACIYAFCRERGLSPLLSFLAVHWLLLATGWAYLLRPWLGNLSFEPTWPDNYIIFGRYLNPGVISYFFQTPYCIGLSIFFLTLALIFRAADADSLANLVSAGFVLGGLSIFQVSLFFSSCLSLGFLWLYRRFRLRQSWPVFFREGACLAAGAIGLAILLGGFFSASTAYSKGLLSFQWPPGYLRYATQASREAVTGTQAILWYFCSLGSLVLLFPAALFGTVRRAWSNTRFEPVFFAVFSLVCLLLPQFFHYNLSWDIIKWFTGFQFATVMMIFFAWGKEGRWRPYAAWILLPFLVLDTLPSFNFLTTLSLRPPSTWSQVQQKWLRTLSPVPSPSLSILLEELRKSPWDEMVFSTDNWSDRLSYFTGQAMANWDYNTQAFGVLPPILAERRKTMQNLLTNFDLKTLDASPIRWLVFSCADFTGKFSPASQQYIAELVTQHQLEEISLPISECWKVFRYRGAKGQNLSY